MITHTPCRDLKGWNDAVKALLSRVITCTESPKRIFIGDFSCNTVRGEGSFLKTDSCLTSFPISVPESAYFCCPLLMETSLFCQAPY